MLSSTARPSWTFGLAGSSAAGPIAGSLPGSGNDWLRTDGWFALAITLDVALPSVDDRATAADLVRAAHQVCPYSNATRGNIDVDLLLDGEPL